MASKYVIIQYVPNPLADERINIGVVAYGGGEIQSRFLSRWDRVRAFGLKNVSFLREFAGTTVKHLKHEGDSDEQLTERIRAMANRWDSGIQLTEPRASLKPAVEVLNDVCVWFLSEKRPAERTIRDRKVAARVGLHALRTALARRVGDRAEDLVKKSLFVRGSHQGHKFDGGIANGVPYVAMSGVSFEGAPSVTLENHLDSLAWAVTDVRRIDRSLQIGVVVLPPTDESPHADRSRSLYEDRLRVFNELGTGFIQESQIDRWAEQAVDSITV